MNIKSRFSELVEDVIGTTEKITDTLGSGVNSIKDGVGDLIDTVTQLPKDIKYISKKNEEIKEILETTKSKIEPIREATNLKLEELGKVKFDISDTTLKEYITHIYEIENLSFEEMASASLSDNEFNFTKHELEDMQVSLLSVKELMKNGVGAGATGALSVGAAYSAVAAFGAASTGTLISTISGAAAGNATLAWLGGGALAAGGGGIALGTVVLGGIAIVPAVSYFIWQGKFNYSQEREDVEKNFTEVLEYAQSIDDIIKNFEELSRLIDNTIVLLNKYTLVCNQLNKQTDHIKNQIGLDYSKYTDKQASLIQKHITYTTKLIELINTPVMKEEGSFNEEMISILKSANSFLENEDEIVFVSFKKSTPSWIYIVSVLGLVCVSTGLILYFRS